MSKVFGQLIALSLVLCMVAVGALADGMSPFYIGTSTINASCSKDGSTANCEGSIRPSDSSYTASVTVTLQKKDGTWKKVSSWSATASKGLDQGAAADYRSR